ncbi:MAG: hypothetical protein KKD44_20500 [Proteobacteria bacterium]|nr:hypothetical protein [Pseudomonadota bacterium]
MEPKELFVKAVGFQKENFEKTYNYFTKIQEQAEQKVNAFVEGTAFIPGPAKELYKQWADTARSGREALKKYADEGYQGIETYLGTTA